jgi:phosphoribosylformylglycinamidine synthase
VVDIGDGWAVAFKIESHNHPSAIEPFQGARPEWRNHSRYFHHGRAPGVPAQFVAFRTDYWRFEESRYQPAAFRGVIEGIAHYGNCIGVPTIGGEIYFDEKF